MTGGTLDRLRSLIEQISALREREPGHPDASVWLDDLWAEVRELCGEDSQEYAMIIGAEAIRPPVQGRPGEGPAEIMYRVRLDQRESVAKVILNRLEKGRAPTPRRSVTASSLRAKVFVSHGPPGEPLRKLTEFLGEIGVDAVVVEEQPSQTRSVVKNVKKYAGDCSGAIVLATRDRSIRGQHEPNPGVLVEIGDLRNRFPDKTVFLVQEGVSKASMWAEHVHIPFTGNHVEEAFTRLVRELKAMGLL